MSNKAKLIVLGTGNGDDPICYNTCFCLDYNGKLFLVDGGGGNQILLQLKAASIDFNNIHDIFISHNHPDHIIGIIWILKRICGAIRKGKYIGDCRIYASNVTINAIRTMRDLMFNKKNILDEIKFITVTDGETKEICNMQVKFFDIHAQKDKQFGFSINNNYLVFAGDEYLKTELLNQFKNCIWLLHEAFCLACDEENYHPFSMGHGTVKNAATTASKLKAQNLVMWHTTMNNLAERKRTYTAEAEEFFSGNVFVPNDLEIIDL